MNLATSKSLAFVAVCGLALTATAEAHEAGSAVLRVRLADDHAEVTYALPLRALAAVVPNLDPNGDGLLSPTESRSAASQLAIAVVQGLSLRTADGALAPSVIGLVPASRQAQPLGETGALLGVVLRYPAPTSELRVRYLLGSKSELPRKLLVELPSGNTGILGAGQDELSWRPATNAEVVGELALEGGRHIFAGWDHLAFLLALLIVTRKPKKVLLLVSAFTLAHSVTLGLTALGVVSPPLPLVEALIALSIVYVAFENLILRGGQHRAALTFGFGLIHGMGFGSALAELDLSNPLPALLGFNVGVEVGQLLVVAAVLPILALIRRKPALYKHIVVTGGSVAIGSMGVYWLVERLGSV
jgi:hypothetical protein